MKQYIGKEVILKFDDHALYTKGKKDSSNDHPIECWARGRIIKITPKSIILESWTCCSADPETRDINKETFTIVRKAIKEIEVLKTDFIVKLL